MQFMGICLVTDDVISLAKFYDAILMTSSERNDKHVEIQTEGAWLAIYSKDAAKDDMNLHFKKERGNFTLQFIVEDIESEFQRLKKMGVEFINEPVTYPWGSRSMQFKDPEDNIISFAQRN